MIIYFSPLSLFVLSSLCFALAYVKERLFLSQSYISALCSFGEREREARSAVKGLFGAKKRALHHHHLWRGLHDLEEVKR